jgi:hypothetical protein
VTIRTIFKTRANQWLQFLNVRIETLTAERTEIARLTNLEKNGHFNRPIFPIPEQFQRCDPAPIFQNLVDLKTRTEKFAAERRPAYSYANDYFTSPDADVAYALVHRLRPKQLIEIGSGNSTRLFRDAISDAGQDTALISIDPIPRVDITSAADRILQKPLEQVPVSYFHDQLGHNDILFIDSSHQIRVGNDVVLLIVNILPILKSGVAIHFHDIFLPFEYPREWVIGNRWDWTEQYLVQALLQGSDEYEVMWPGHFLQRTMPTFASYFDPRFMRTASSLWLRKLA